MALPKWVPFFRAEQEAAVEYLEEGDPVWVEFPPEWDSWDGKPTYRPGELMLTDVVAQQGFVVYLNAGNLPVQGWYGVERLHKRTQRMWFDRPEPETTTAHAAEAVYAAI